MNLWQQALVTFAFIIIGFAVIYFLHKKKLI